MRRHSKKNQGMHVLTKDEVCAAVCSFVGENNVLCKHEDLVCYTYNAGGAAPSPHVPMLVAFPATADEVSKIVGFCNSQGISIVPRAQGSGLSVNAIPESPIRSSFLCNT